MESKTLNTIQILAKIGKIISKIIAICCIVGAIGCLVGIIAMAVCDSSTIKIGDLTIHGLIEKNSELSMGTIYVSMAVGMILCIGEGVMARLSCKYFKNELEAGTPFTLDGAKELLRLGICLIAISIGTLIVADITYAIINHYMADVADMHIDQFNQVGMGIVFIFTSLICKYGAEREAQIQGTVENKEVE